MSAIIRKKHITFLWLLGSILFTPLAEPRAAENYFDGIYFALKLGWSTAYNDRQCFSAGDGESLCRTTKNGWGSALAFGTRIQLDLPVWIRSELELGFQRHAINSHQQGQGKKDRSQTVNLLWNNYIHFLDMNMDHQLWAGLGVGGAFAEAKLSQTNLTTADSRGTNILMASSLGYDYRFLERSRFSDEFLRLGVESRFLFADGFREELTAQINIVLTYGF